ncbi:single-stranded DNA-binding protein [Pseudomonas gingeri]|uniref:Single-stranded DNA-binding protein n=1 Tax=Pseudomonas gingeri TaxID=117681 RepID=A0A7Y7YIN4_9PSED|nr:single-stranded DNA-binding protein [Pseudomonas gingeri]NWB31167.1 single-stranded DNA-binding protein [Pseudomonas gingeri]NWC37062.1 single-stranded DNA-binding protein [Pseudomonas gingeri]
MSTHFWGEGNIGTKPEFKEFPNGNNAPRRLLRLNVYFNNPIPKKDGEYEDRGGYWAGVEMWHKDAEHYSQLYCKGMRVLIVGRMVMDKWEDEEGETCRAMKVQASRIGILPHRVDSLVMIESDRSSAKASEQE